MTGIRAEATKGETEARTSTVSVASEETEISVPMSDISSTPAMAGAKPEATVKMAASGATGAVVNRAALIAERESLAGSSSGYATTRRRVIAEALGETKGSNSFGFGD